MGKRKGRRAELTLGPALVRQIRKDKAVVCAAVLGDKETFDRQAQ